MKPPLCFLVGPWDKLNQGVSNRDQGAAAAADTSKVSYKENSPALEISDKVAGCERDGSDSFSCGVFLMITFQLAFHSSWELFQAPSSRLSLGHEDSPILLLLGIQAPVCRESFIRGLFAGQRTIEDANGVQQEENVHVVGHLSRSQPNACSPVITVRQIRTRSGFFSFFFLQLTY